MSARPATACVETPVGMVELVAGNSVLISARIGAPGGIGRHDADHHLLNEAIAQIVAWFAGQRREFTLPLEPAKTLEAAQLRAAIASVPYGDTSTYGALANRAGSVARAIGQACKTNPFPIIIPCHRIVSASGPEYYSGGKGPETKAWLIDFEADHSHGIRTRLI